MDASVIICTLNRNESLKLALDSMRVQTLAPERFEVLAVDNGPNDATQDLVKSYSTQGAANIRYIAEHETGLSHARNRGIKESVGEIVAFIDDDAEADKHWLNNLVVAFDDPRVYCAGGTVRPIWPERRPEWLPDWLLDYLAITEHKSPPQDNLYRFPGYPVGANIAFQKKAFDEFGGFTENLGRTGLSLLSNEETEFCLRLEEAGALLKFVPEAVVYHHISPERLSKEWFFQRLFSQGQSDAALDFLRNRDIVAHLKEKHIPAICKYHAETNSDFSAECRFREALGYISKVLEVNQTVENNQKQFIEIFSVITEGIFAGCKNLRIADRSVSILMNKTLKRLQNIRRNTRS